MSSSKACEATIYQPPCTFERRGMSSIHFSIITVIGGVRDFVDCVFDT